MESNYGDWLPLTEFGPRHIRKFLRRHKNNVPNTVNSWTKLWGFPSDPDITINTIELVTNYIVLVIKIIGLVINSIILVIKYVLVTNSGFSYHFSYHFLFRVSILVTNNLL